MPILALLANRLVIAGLAFALLGAWGAWNRYQFNAVTAEYESFKVSTKAAGIAAQQAADARIAADKVRKEQSDEKLNKRIATLKSDNVRLQRNSSASSLPAPAPDSKCPSGLACYDKGELEQTIRQLDAEVSQLVDEGSEISLRLDTAIRWAASIKP